VTNVTNKRGATVLSSYAYTYRLDGNQISKTDHNSTVTEYEYDDLGRLLTENNIAYTYDARGNRATMTTPDYTTVYEYDANNRLLSTTKTTESGEYTTTYTYDANGAQLSRIGSTPPELLTLTSQPETEIDTYNARGQLVSAYLAGQTAVYTYRPDGLRATKTVEGETTKHVWDGANIIADVGTAVTRYVRGVNLLFAETAFVKQYYLYNAHGDVVQLTDTWGEVEHEYHYDAFGVEVGAGAGDANQFRYCGEYFDTETGTVYLRARKYDAGTGRFTSEDPIRAGANWYTYSANNPIAFIDPSGLDAILINKTVDIPFAEDLGIEHMSAFFQDSDGVWWFFYWGGDVKLIKVEDVYSPVGCNGNPELVFDASTIFDSMDNVNQWLRLVGALGDDQYDYRTSVYVVGDFDASVAEGRRLANAYAQSLEDGTAGNVSQIKSKFGTQNNDYNFIMRNCGQETMRLFFMGTLENGMNVGVLALVYGFGISPVPDINLNRMQFIFANTALNYNQYRAQIARINAYWRAMLGPAINFV
jgi:RHS repeat-associated protein